MIHKKCGKIAFYHRGVPKVGDTTRSELAMGPNGEEIKPGDEMKCFSCGERFRFGRVPLTLFDIQEEYETL